MPLTLKCKITAIAPDGTGLETDIPNGAGTPFTYYPRNMQLCSPESIGKTLTVTFASEMVRKSEHLV